MEERAVAGPSGEVMWYRKRSARLSLSVGSQRFPILSLDKASCLIGGESELPSRGWAEIFDGERLTALCLILPSQREGETRRVVFKQFTPARSEVPLDYAVDGV